MSSKINILLDTWLVKLVKLVNLIINVLLAKILQVLLAENKNWPKILVQYLLALVYFIDYFRCIYTTVGTTM